jgi:hypothetical protein
MQKQSSVAVSISRSQPVDENRQVKIRADVGIRAGRGEVVGTEGRRGQRGEGRRVPRGTEGRRTEGDEVTEGALAAGRLLCCRRRRLRRLRPPRCLRRPRGRRVV